MLALSSGCVWRAVLISDILMSREHFYIYCSRLSVHAGCSSRHLSHFALWCAHVFVFISILTVDSVVFFSTRMDAEVGISIE